MKTVIKNIIIVQIVEIKLIDLIKFNLFYYLIQLS